MGDNPASRHLFNSDDDKGVVSEGVAELGGPRRRVDARHVFSGGEAPRHRL